MLSRFKRILAFVLVICLCVQTLVGCASENNSNGNSNVITEDVIKEEYILEESILEERLEETYIVENLIYENGIYEYQIEEIITAQSYIFEMVVGETSEEEILENLPDDFDDYDIDWAKVIGKFAAGTAIIVAVGVVGHVTKGSSYFMFATPAKVAKEALIGGATEAAIMALLNKDDNDPLHQKAKKYALEGFAEGYMYGAMSAVLKVNSQNIKRLKTFKHATGGTSKIKLDGKVYDEAGKLIGEALVDKDGLWRLVNHADDTIQVFDSKGKELLKLAGTALPSNAKLTLGAAAKAVVCYTDDLGQIIRKGNALQPNIVFQLGGHTYHTDSKGRIVKVVFDKLELKEVGRNRLKITDTMDDIAKGYAKTGDQRGHLIADMFNGDNTLANIVPMSQQANQTDVAAIEALWKKCLENGGNVSGTIEIRYNGSSFRPDDFTYMYDMGSGMIKKIISNL